MLTSTYSMAASLRRSLSLLQTSLSRSQKEFTTGRHADLAITLGWRTSHSFTLVGTKSTIEATLSSNNITATRLDSIQTTLAALLADAQDMRKTVISAQPNEGDAPSLVSKAQQALADTIDKLNTSINGSFIFGGVSSDQAPINNYFADPASPAKTALDSAFVTAFGFTQSSASVASISSTQIQAFLNGPFDSLFSATDWKTTWSNASDTNRRSQISLSGSIETSVSANEPALRQLAKTYTMLSDLGGAKMTGPAYAVVLKSATDTLNSSIESLMKIQSRVGIMQSAVKNASDVMKLQQDTVSQQLADLEGVDTMEAGSRVQSLLTQIETAYTLTARISQLTLTKYL